MTLRKLFYAADTRLLWAQIYYYASWRPFKQNNVNICHPVRSLTYQYIDKQVDQRLRRQISRYVAQQLASSHISFSSRFFKAEPLAFY